jgi:AcrR family transcriptional regulator
MISAKEKWLETGYEQFAILGPDKLSINRLSKAVGLSRASFYHHFGDIEGFIEALLAQHWQICQEFDQAGRKRCRVLFPDLYLLLAAYPVPLRFHLQLFHHRSVPAYHYLFTKAYTASSRAFVLQLFAEHCGLSPDREEVYHLWLALTESWYSRLDPEDLSANTLEQHARDILKTLFRFMESKLFLALQT